MSIVINFQYKNYEINDFDDLNKINKINENFEKYIIFMKGLTGSGKSHIAKKICDYLNLKIGKSVILSKDDFRYTDSGYVYTPEFEVSVTKKYNAKLKSYLISKTIKYIILDNTHLDIKKYLDTRNVYQKLLNDKKLTELIICIEPYNDINEHTKYNIHNVPIEGVARQFEQYNENKKEIEKLNINSIEIKRNEDKIINEKKLNLVFSFLNKIFIK
jgi:DNA replication protein DnaC